MKKIFKLLIIAFSFFIFSKTTSIKAQEVGTCIIKAQEKTYNVNAPFYWYTAYKESITNNSLSTTDNYNHIEKYINDEAGCKSINNSLIKREQPYKGNFLSYKITNYFFATNKLTDSKLIYDKSIETFNFIETVGNVSINVYSEFISLDNLPPVIAKENLDSVIITSMNNFISIDSLKSKIKAYDEVDGITEILISKDDYSNNKSTPGIYEITFSSSDKSGNTAYLSIKIKVIDNIKPTITGPSTLKSYMSKPLSLEEIKNKLIINDNYDQNIENRLVIKEDNYSNNTNKLGTFLISFYVTDLSNNKSDIYTINIEMLDDIPPTISGKNSYTTTYNNKLNIDEIKNSLTLSDNISANITIDLSFDNYSLNYFIPGSYEIGYIAKDESNNESEVYIITIKVEDTEKPIFFISQKFIGINSSSNIPVEEIIETLENDNNIDKSTILYYEVLEDTYSNSKTIPGEYKIKLYYEFTNENIIIEADVIVEDLSVNKDTAKEKTPKKSLWSVIKNILLSIWNFIKRIFSFLF